MSLSQFRSAHLPLASIHNFGLEVPPGNAISEGRPPLWPLQHELGSGSSRYRRYVSRMTRTKNFLRQNVFKVFLKTTFFHDSCQPDHYEPKIFFRFSKSGSTLRYTIWTRGFLLVMRSRKAGFPFATRARKLELSIQEVRIENDSDQKFSKTKCFQNFSENHFFPRFMST